jgi:hypothetical protein
MINILDKNNKLLEQKNSINITYPRNINIIFGNYPYPEIIHSFILEIKNNLNPKMQNYTNVKGGMTEWGFFKENTLFKNFIIHLINKHQLTHPGIFEYFLEQKRITHAWGNEIKPGDSLDFHTHPCYHGVLYLTKGADLILPELNLKITPEPGDYYIFPPEIIHGFPPYEGELSRYSLIFNIDQSNTAFDLNKKQEVKRLSSQVSS